MCNLGRYTAWTYICSPLNMLWKHTNQHGYYAGQWAGIKILLSNIFFSKVIGAYIGLVICHSLEANWWQWAQKDTLLLMTGQQLLHCNAKVLSIRELLSSTTVVFEQFKIFCNIIVILEIGRDTIIQVAGGRHQCMKMRGWLGSTFKLESPKPGISSKSGSLSLANLYQPNLSEEGFSWHIISAGSRRKKDCFSSTMIFLV